MSRIDRSNENSEINEIYKRHHKNHENSEISKNLRLLFLFNHYYLSFKIMLSVFVEVIKSCFSLLRSILDIFREIDTDNIYELAFRTL